MVCICSWREKLHVYMSPWSMPRQTTNEDGAQVSPRWLDCKEVFILLLRHLGSAGIGVNLNVTCHEGDRQLR